MKKTVLLFFSFCVALTAMSQNNYILETKFRNPVDTAKFHQRPTLLLFSHSKCQNATRCATLRMQEALEKDSMQIRRDRGIKLYVIQPSGYNKKDIDDFESLEPVDAELLFYMDRDCRGSFSEPNLTPFVRLYDGKGNVYIKVGGSYSELCDMIKDVLL